MKYDTVKLGEVCYLVNGSAFKSKDFQDSGVPVIKIANVKPNKLILTDLKCVSETIADQYARSQIKYGDILLTMTGNRMDGGPDSWVGKAAMFRENGRYMLNQRLCIVRPNTKLVDPVYLSYALSSWDAQMYFITRSTSSGGQANISPAIINSFELPLPPMEIQKKIANVLNQLDLKIHNNYKVNDNLQAQSQLFYKEMIVNGASNGWEKTALGNLVEMVKKVFNPAKEKETMLEHYSIPAFDDDKFPVFESSSKIKSNKYIISKDCFMISKLNPTTKRVWRPYCLTGNAVCSTEFIVYTAINKLMTDYLFAVIDSDDFSDYMCSHVTGSTGSRQRTIPNDTLQYLVWLPDEDTLERFIKTVQPMYSLIKKNSVESNRLKMLRDELAPKLISGEIPC